MRTRASTLDVVPSLQWIEPVPEPTVWPVSWLVHRKPGSTAVSSRSPPVMPAPVWSTHPEIAAPGWVVTVMSAPELLTGGE